MNNEIAFRVFAADSTVMEILAILKADQIKHGLPRPLRGGTEPLNAPIDIELMREVTQTIMISLGSAAAILGLAEKLVDVATRLRRKISILLGPTSTIVHLEGKQDLERLKDELAKLKIQKSERDTIE